MRPEPRAISHLPFVLLCAGVLAAGLICVLLLNTALAKGSYEAHALEDGSAQLEERQQQLAAVLATRQGPQGLAARAQELGMVRPDSVRWLDLTTGTVSGTATRARAGDQPSIVTEPSYLRTAPPASTPSASPGATPSPTPVPTTSPGAPAPRSSATAGPSATAAPTATAGPTAAARQTAIAPKAAATRAAATTRAPAAADATGR
ncbi:MAG TPA: hypothetical protein VES01_09555 [Dermatophilaceae bacterium]|nr:hypothetical protein [Dermatophilaceae bacterium]